MIGACIVDTCVAVKWIVLEADARLAARLQAAELHAPDLLHYELANALRTRVRVGDIPASAAQRGLDLVRNAPVALESTGTLLDAALALALAINHPLGDCVFLALARQRSLPLVTVDQTLLRKARRDLSGIAVLSLAEAVA